MINTKTNEMLWYLDEFHVCDITLLYIFMCFTIKIFISTLLFYFINMLNIEWLCSIETPWTHSVHMHKEFIM